MKYEMPNINKQLDSYPQYNNFELFGNLEWLSQEHKVINKVKSFEKFRAIHLPNQPNRSEYM